jgi:hypothetical protein
MGNDEQPISADHYFVKVSLDGAEIRTLQRGLRPKLLCPELAEAYLLRLRQLPDLSSFEVCSEGAAPAVHDGLPFFPMQIIRRRCYQTVWPVYLRRPGHILFFHARLAHS